MNARSRGPLILPSFLIIGAPRAGTTSLYEYLRLHPDVFMSAEKEPEFFSSETKWNRGLEAYARLFQRASKATAVGEASTAYTKYPRVRDVPERIASVLPNVRLIYLVRHPIERMVSHYRFRVAKGWEQREIDDALATDVRYLAPSRYAMQLERYLAHHDRERILLLRTEDLRSARGPGLARVLRFVGVDPDRMPASGELRMNATESHRLHPVPDRIRRAVRRVPGYEVVVGAIPISMRNAMTRPFARLDQERALDLAHRTRQALLPILLDDVRKLEAITGESFDSWDLTR